MTDRSVNRKEETTVAGSFEILDLLHVCMCECVHHYRLRTQETFEVLGPASVMKSLFTFYALTALSADKDS